MSNTENVRTAFAAARAAYLKRYENACAVHARVMRTDGPAKALEASDAILREARAEWAKAVCPIILH